MPDYLERILTARVYDVAQETPLDCAPNLSARLNNQLLLKREDMQSVFSFKLRGAYNKMAQLPPDVLAQGRSPLLLETTPRELPLLLNIWAHEP